MYQRAQQDNALLFNGLLAGLTFWFFAVSIYIFVLYDARTIINRGLN